MNKDIYNANALGGISVKPDGAIQVYDVGCGCCSSAESISVHDALELIDVEIATLQAARAELLKLRNQGG
jgi:hypothetical protein